MKIVGLNLSQPVLLLDFCFKNLDFSATQLADFEACLITLFVVITFFDPIYQYVSYNLNNKFAWLYNVGNAFFDSIL